MSSFCIQTSSDVSVGEGSGTIMFFLTRNADMNTGQVRRPEKLEVWEKYLKIKDVINGAPKLVGTQFHLYIFFY